MAEDRLRISAEVEDRFTAPLGRMKTALKSATDEGAKGFAGLKRDAEGFQGVFSRARTAIEGFTPALSAMGVGSIGATLALGGTIAALRSFSTSTRDLSIFSKEVGLATNELRAVGRIGEDFGVSAQTMQNGVKHFADEMSNFRKRWGQTYIELQAQGLGDLAEKLVKAPNMRAALEAAFEGLAQITDPIKRQKFAETLLGSREFSQVIAGIGGRLGRELREMAEQIGELSPATEKAAQDFEKHMGRIGDAAERLKLGVLGPALKGIVGLIDDFDKNGLSGNDQEQALRRQISPFGGADPSAQQKLEGRRSSVQQQLDLLDKNPSAPDYQRKRDRMVEELKRVADELEKLRNQGDTVQQQSFSGPAGGGALIQKAALGGGYGFGGGSLGVGGGYGAYGAPSGGEASSSGSPALGRTSPPLGRSEPALGGEGGSGAAPPRGNGRGNPRAARTSDMMAYAMDQLRREGVPEQHLRQAAAHLVGQAHMESGLDPNKTHDPDASGRPTGYGIYGTRLPRRDRMLRWLEANGYARNSAEGQMRYMAHEAMNDRAYRATRRILMGQGTGDVDADTNTITKNFEAPKYINRRSSAVRNAYRTGSSEQAANPLDGEKNTGMSRLRNSDIDVSGSGERMGDAMMRRLYGDQPPVARGPMAVDGKASLHIKFENAPAGMRTSSKTEGLFQDVTVSKSVQLARLT